MEPMGSFSEFRCSVCKTSRDVPTREVEAANGRLRRVVAWPNGWAYRAIGNFGMAVCNRCTEKQQEATS